MHNIIDFTTGKIAYRIRHASFKNELLAKAISIKPKENPIIVDATAGLGRDAMVLASLGYHIIMLERSDVLYENLRSGLEHAKSYYDFVDNLTLIHADAIDWLKIAPKPDVIYLDPMFGCGNKKSAASRKEIVWLQSHIGEPTDSNLLFETALSCAKFRVVVKRPRLGAAISSRLPHYSIKGSSSRFDVYLT